MANVNLFTANLQGRELIKEKSLTKKAVNAALADYFKSIDAEFTKVIKSEDVRARNVANAAKGKFKTALQVVASCYPYQTKDGVLCCKHKGNDGSRLWAEKKLTASAARGIVRESLKNYTQTVGAPVVTTVVVGVVIE